MIKVIRNIGLEAICSTKEEADIFKERVEKVGYKVFEFNICNRYNIGGGIKGTGYKVRAHKSTMYDMEDK